ncbi:MAG: ribonuclease Z [Cyclobacteriaceae bacterium]
MSLELQILGSNSAAFAHRRHHTSQLLKVQNQHFLIDCGEGTQLLLKKYHVKISRIDHIFISHMHGDHYFGLIGLLSTMHLFGREKELTLVAPPGLAEIISLQLKHSQTWLMYKINFVEFTPDAIELVFENQQLTVHTIPMNHAVPCSGFLFREKPKRRRINRKMIEDEEFSPLDLNRLKNGEDLFNSDGSLRFENKVITMDPFPSFTYAYCSDTLYKPDIIEQIKGADLLYHESTFADDMEERAHTTYHSTAKEAAEIAKEAGVGKLVLGHFSARYRELDIILEEAKSVFADSELAIEGTKFVVDGK